MEGGTAGGGNEAGLGVFSCWCPKVMCLIGRLPETLADRCIVIRMQRKLAGENCERLRRLVTEEVRRKCARFVQDHANAIATNEPPVPESLHDRAGDIWEPLLALAEIAGADWPERARQSAIGLTNSAQENCPIGTLLLDAYVLFSEAKVERIFSRDMAGKLNCYSNRPWKEGIKGKLVTDTWLAKLLRPYGIRPSTMRIGEEVGRGYEAEDFVQAIQRYVPKAELKAMLSEARTPQKLEVKAPTGDGPPPVEADWANGESEPG